MKSEKGITLITLIVSIIVLIIAVSILTTVSNFFFYNKKYLSENSKNIGEYNKFAMYFIEDCKKNKDTYEVSDDKVIFNDGTIYTYGGAEDKSIYRNKVKICKEIEYCKFSKSEETTNNVTKKIINVNIIIKGIKNFVAENQFVLKYW